MGIIEELIGGLYARALYPIYEQVQEQHRQMQDEVQRVCQAQAIIEILYENQELRKQFDEYLDESIRCWFKRNIN